MGVTNAVRPPAGDALVDGPFGPVGRRPMLVEHRLVGDPRFSRPALAELAAQLGPTEIEHHLSDLPLILPTGESPQLGSRPAEVVAGLDTNGCWIALFKMERHGSYADVLARCLQDWRQPFASEGGIEETTASVFLASPRSRTPAHVDRHHNVLLQLEGTKQVMTGAFDNWEDEAVELARHFGPDHLNFSTLPPHATVWTLRPGLALYLPPYMPHWVITGPEVTVSLSCVVRTPASRRLELTHTYNNRLRRYGLHPRRPGESALIDRAKATTVVGWRQARRLLAAAPTHVERLGRTAARRVSGDTRRG